MFISEIYESRQGEGRLTGVVSVFLRTSGCNLRCGFCDTPYASWNPEGTSMRIAEVLKAIEDFPSRHVVITGGEPMISFEIEELCNQLRRDAYHITIETAGTVFRELECDLMSISPKLSNSTPPATTPNDWFVRHERTRHRPEIVRRLIQRYDYQLKFVIGSPRDAEEALGYLDEVGCNNRSRILMMPEGTEVSTLDAIADWLKPWCDSHEVTYCDRAHIRWYGNMRST